MSFGFSFSNSSEEQSFKMKHFFRKSVQKLTKSSMHCHCMPAFSIFSCFLLFVCIRLRFILWINNNRLFIGIILISVNYYRYFMCSTMCISKKNYFWGFWFRQFWTDFTMMNSQFMCITFICMKIDNQYISCCCVSTRGFAV